MDRIKIAEKVRQLMTEYKYVFIIFAAGILLMIIPGKQKSEEITVHTQQQIQKAISFEEELASLLEKIEGAGKVEVLLTEAEGELVSFQTDDEQHSLDSRRTSTVIITDSNKNQEGLVQQILAPIYRGAVVVCQGGDKAAVRLAIVEAVSNATGLSTDKISVLKMK